MAPFPCSICNKTTPSKSCASCHSITYCSAACQKSDWPTHKLVCALLADTHDRPSEEHVLGFLFHPRTVKPAAIWIHASQRSVPLIDASGEIETGGGDADADGERKKQFVTIAEVDVDSYLRGEEEFDDAVVEKGSVVVERNTTRQRDMDRCVEVFFRQDAIVRGADVNVCVRRCTENKALLDWRGPVVVVARMKDSEAYVDATGRVFRDIVDWFILPDGGEDEITDTVLEDNAEVT